MRQSAGNLSPTLSEKICLVAEAGYSVRYRSFASGRGCLHHNLGPTAFGSWGFGAALFPTRSASCVTALMRGWASALPPGRKLCTRARVEGAEGGRKPLRSVGD